MTNKLILLTSGFPYGASEPFLKSEVDYLSLVFDEISIIAVNPENDNSQFLGSKCSVKVLRHTETIMDKLKASFNIFSLMFLKELIIVNKVYKKQIRLNILATILMGLYRAKKIKKTIEKNYDLSNKEKIYLYSYWCDDSALGLAMIQNKYPSVKSFSRIHGWDVYFEVNDINYLAFRHYITDSLKTIFSISNKGKQYCNDVWKIKNTDKIIVSRLGVSVQTPLILSQELLLVSCSNLIPLKRVNLIIQALSNIIDLNIKWVHFGDGKERENLELLANTILNTNITWEFKGWMPNDEIMKWYKANSPSLFINVSSSEGIPVSIMEAISFGIPIIATNVGGTSEIVDNKNGYLLSSDPDVTEITSAIKDYNALNLEQKKIKQELVLNKWFQEFNAEKNYTEFNKMISEL